MRERRATVRVGCFLPTEYRLSDGGSLASKGHITNLSLQGLRLLTPDRLGGGERVSVRFTLPSDEEPFAAGGIIRWNGSESAEQGEYPVGIELQGLDETSHFRLQAFVTDQVQRSGHLIGRVSRTVSRFQQRIPSRMVGLWTTLAGLVVVTGLGLWVVALQRQNIDLRWTLAARTLTISRLQARQRQLLEELAQVKAQHAQSVAEVEHLQSETTRLGNEVGGLTQSFGELKQEYGRVRDERERLTLRVTQLQQQETVLEQRFRSIPDLRKAMRDATLAKSQALREERAKWIAQLQEIDRQALQHGNRGFLVYQGVAKGMPASGRLSIRVHTPEPTESPIISSTPSPR